MRRRCVLSGRECKVCEEGVCSVQCVRRCVLSGRECISCEEDVYIV